jgi:hypothetical protein
MGFFPVVRKLLKIDLGNVLDQDVFGQFQHYVSLGQLIVAKVAPPPSFEEVQIVSDNVAVAVAEDAPDESADFVLDVFHLFLPGVQEKMIQEFFIQQVLLVGLELVNKVGVRIGQA